MVYINTTSIRMVTGGWCRWHCFTHIASHYTGICKLMFYSFGSPLCNSTVMAQLWPWLLVITGYFYGIKYMTYKWGFLSTYNWYNLGHNSKSRFGDGFGDGFLFQDSPSLTRMFSPRSLSENSLVHPWKTMESAWIPTLWVCQHSYWKWP